MGVGLWPWLYCPQDKWYIPNSQVVLQTLVLVWESVVYDSLDGFEDGQGHWTTSEKYWMQILGVHV
jgi:hypothetical protein